MFDNSVSASRTRFASSPSDLQPTTDESVEDKTNTRLEKDPPQTSDAYTPPSLVGNTAHLSSSNKLSRAEIITQEFPLFDAESLIFHPMLEEESSDEKFYKELGEQLIESLLTFHAWAAARPRHEHNVVCNLITSKMAKIEETEKDQGRYYTTLCPEKPLPLSSLPYYHDLKHREIGHEDKYPLLDLDACPHSPPRSNFLCSRSLEQNRKRLADFVERMTNALAVLAEMNSF